MGGLFIIKQRFTADDFLNIEDFRQIEDEIAKIANKRGVLVQPLDLSQGVATIPMASFINIIEKNISALTEGLSIDGLEPTKTWMGEDGDENWLDYKDVNRWFDTLEIIRAYIK